jgi:excisionase family DNA binding protein
VPTATVTAEEIAADLGVNIHTVRRWFREGQLPGRKVGRHGWTTPADAYARWIEAQPAAPDSVDTLTAEDIARECGVGIVTVRRWFKTGGLPGEKLRGIADRGATWRTTRPAFDTWYRAYLTGAHPAADQLADELAADVEDARAARLEQMRARGLARIADARDPGQPGDEPARLSSQPAIG